MKLKEIWTPKRWEGLEDNLVFLLGMMIRYGFSKQEILIFVGDALDEIEKENNI